MAYRFKPGRSLTHEVRRIAGRQLDLAIGELAAVGSRRADQSVHEARRHVKKVRALLKLVRPALGDRYTASNRRLRRASRMLADIADGEAVLDAVDVLGAARTPVPPRTAAILRAALRAREAQIDRKARLERVLPKVASVLRVERQRVDRLALNAHGIRAIAGGLEASVRRMRRAAARAAAAPTAANYHAWRRRAKDVWLHVRLLDERCGGELQTIERHLDALDGVLGEYHNVVLLEQILTADAVLPRLQTAQCVKGLRQHQVQLRRRAAIASAAIGREKPRHFVRRVRHLWRPARPAGAARGERWPRAA